MTLSLNCAVLVAQSHRTLCDPVDCSPPGSAVNGISQARILEWVTIPFSREYSQPRDQTWVSCIADRLSTIWATRKAPLVFLMTFPDRNSGVTSSYRQMLAGLQPSEGSTRAGDPVPSWRTHMAGSWCWTQLGAQLGLTPGITTTTSPAWQSQGQSDLLHGSWLPPKQVPQGDKAEALPFIDVKSHRVTSAILY